MLGARVFEKHFTINRSWKGTDQSFSLEPTGLKKLIRNLNRIPVLLGSAKKYLLKSEKNAVYKMSKCIVAKKFIRKNTKIKMDHLDFKSPGDGLKPYEYNKVLNKKIKVNKQKDEIINIKDFK